jgi:hypothetical protein
MRYGRIAASGAVRGAGGRPGARTDMPSSPARTLVPAGALTSTDTAGLPGTAAVAGLAGAAGAVACGVGAAARGGA